MEAAQSTEDFREVEFKLSYLKGLSRWLTDRVYTEEQNRQALEQIISDLNSLAADILHRECASILTIELASQWRVIANEVEPIVRKFEQSGFTVDGAEDLRKLLNEVTTLLSLAETVK
jgi:hypothetical protein